MRRREFITLLGGAAVAWPFAARAQQGERVRRVGILLPAAADDAVFQARVGAFLQELGKLGWNIGRNLQIDTRWATSNAAELRRQAAELAALAPDVILAGGSSSLGPLLQATRTVPIVFTLVVDPVGTGLVDSLARPGGNATGFMNWEYSMGGKWLELAQRNRAGRDARGRSSEMPPKALQPANLPSSRPWRHRSGWRSTRSMCATPLRSSAPSRPSGNSRMAGWS